MTIELPPRTDSRDELVLRITFERGRFQALLDRLSDDTKLAPLPAGDWSINDHVAHLTAWAGKALAAIEGRPAHVGLGLESPPADPRDYDAINEVLRARDATLSCIEAEERMRVAYEDVVAALRRLKDADLYRPWGDDDLDGATVGEVVSADTYEHCLEHGAWLRERLLLHRGFDIPG